MALEVEDDGIGAPDPPREGTGLTIGRMLTRQLDGVLTREATVRGTRMRLSVGCGGCDAPCSQA